MAKISLAMIVKDEEKTIERVINSVKSFADELIIIDTGSTDSTKQKAESLGAKVFDYQWQDDFADARNYSFSKCTGDWIIWLDADDVIFPECQKKILDLKQNTLDTQDFECIYFRYSLYDSFDYENASSCASPYRERLLKNRPEVKWVGKIHETCDFKSSKILYQENIFVHHMPLPDYAPRKKGRNLAILEKNIAENIDSSPRMYYLLGSELYRVGEIQKSKEAFLTNLNSQDCCLKYSTYLMLNRMCKLLNQTEEAISYCYEAVKFNPLRAEAFCELGIHFYDKLEYQKAITFFMTAANLPRPFDATDGILQDHCYSWLPLEFLANCYYKINNYQSAIMCAMRSFEANHPKKENIINNLYAYITELAKTNKLNNKLNLQINFENACQKTNQKINQKNNSLYMKPSAVSFKY